MLSDKLTQHTHTHTQQRSYAEAHARVAPQSAGCIYYGSALPILSTPVQPPSNSHRLIRDGSRFCVEDQCRTNSSYFGPCQRRHPKHLSIQLLNYGSNWSGWRKGDFWALAVQCATDFPGGSVVELLMSFHDVNYLKHKQSTVSTRTEGDLFHLITN